jgi:hypothetical protein
MTARFTWVFALGRPNNLIPPPRIDRHKPDLDQLIIQRSDCHLSDDIVGLRLVAVIDDLTFLFVCQYGIGSGWTVYSLFRWIDHSTIQNEKRLLNLGNKLPCSTGGDVRGIEMQTSLEPLITFEEL